MRIITLSFVLLLLVATQNVQAQNSSTIVVDGQQRNYLTYVPKNLGEKRPLLISCHGMNQDAAYQMNMMSVESIADTAKFVTVFPNGINKGWDISGNRDINFVKALIDKMVEQYDIDVNRVYLSGFSMGGMFTYHAMNRIPDKIAAFAPISGYPMGGTTANAGVRPLPIIHTHGTSDDVVNFNGVSGALNAWIQHNGCPSTPKITKNYRGASHITRYVWGPGNENVEVVLMELAGKGHWVSNDIVKSADEIWKFCKRFSLEQKDPSVRITSPQSGLRYYTFGGTSDIPTLTVNATASDPDGQVASVAFYDGNALLATFTEAPYTYELTDLKAGEHQIRVVATDDEGRTGSSQVTVSVKEPTSLFSFHTDFTVEGSVPEGWTTYDSSEKRVGFSSGYSAGSRLFHLTGEKRDYEWGLYTRNVNGTKKAGYARLGDPATQTTITLKPGQYQLYYRVSNWNIELFSPVTISVEKTTGEQIFSETFTPTSNIGNSASNSFSGTTLMNSLFDVVEEGRYMITFYTADAPWADLVIGQLALKRVGNVTSIQNNRTSSVKRTLYYNMAGQQVSDNHQGPVIRKVYKSDGTVDNRIYLKK